MTCKFIHVTDSHAAEVRQACAFEDNYVTCALLFPTFTCNKLSDYFNQLVGPPIIFILQAKLMFDGECASLEALYNTATVRVPKPLKV